MTTVRLYLESRVQRQLRCTMPLFFKGVDSLFCVNHPEEYASPLAHARICLECLIERVERWNLKENPGFTLVNKKKFLRAAENNAIDLKFTS